MYLIENVYCTKKQKGERVLIAKRGDKVFIVDDKNHLPVVLIKDLKGNVVSCNKNNLKFTP